MRDKLHKLKLFVALTFFSSIVFCFSSLSWAVEVKPTPAQVEKAIAEGRSANADLEALYGKYSFGDSGVNINGLVMTKLFEITQQSATLASKNKKLDTAKIEEILKKDYLLFPVTLLGLSAADFGGIKVSVRQGMKTVKAGKVIVDKPEKLFCEKETCIWKNEIYAGFYYENFDPKRLVVLVVEYAKKKVEFPLQLGQYP